VITKWLINSDESSRVVSTYLTSNPFLISRLTQIHEGATILFHLSTRIGTPEKFTKHVILFTKDWLKRKKKKRKIWSYVGKMSCLTWGCHQYVIHIRLTIPTRSTTTKSDSVTEQRKKEICESSTTTTRHHYSRKDVFPQETSAHDQILCSK